MKIKIVLCLLIRLVIFNQCLTSQCLNKASWITSFEEDINNPNTWISFRRDIYLDLKPKRAIVKIAADTKYWLWINGQLVIFEGGLKRGPSPQSTYYDQIDFAPYLKKGNNKIALLLWHFGKDGFSHKNSTKSGFILSSDSKDFSLVSDTIWKCRRHPAYSDTDTPHPNFRLAESNIRFDARNDIYGWQNLNIDSLNGFFSAKMIGKWDDMPWGKLILRPIPLWKDFGIKEIEFKVVKGIDKDSIIAVLPHNMQITPIISLYDTIGGSKVYVYTDHSFSGGTHNIRAEYITKKGNQNYESLGWMNGQKIILTISKNILIKKIEYRQTGYDTYPQGKFSCDDNFYNQFWEKALHTLYVNMRDNYFDCPDRERAQWWGDVVVLMGESFYTYSSSTHALMRKAILELIAWQKPCGSLFSPIPAGNYDSELPGQMLSSIGRYGFWNYYLNTGDLETIRNVYPGVKKYLSLWTLDSMGLTNFRAGDWTWGDWGESKDIKLIFAGWHYMALESAANMASILGLNDDASYYRNIMTTIKLAYNKCWNGIEYRHPEYKDPTDDRVHALAVISGIADTIIYPQILDVFKTQFHSSPYMEKYVMEALFIIGHGEYALQRTKQRFSNMVENKKYTTLFEGWDIGDKGYGGGTTNHAWSGGAVTVIGQYLFGIKPLEAGYSTFEVQPNIATLKKASIEVPTIKGIIALDFIAKENQFEMRLVVPLKTISIITLPKKYQNIYINNSIPNSNQTNIDDKYIKENKMQLRFTPGIYNIILN